MEVQLLSPAPKIEHSMASPDGGVVGLSGGIVEARDDRSSTVTGLLDAFESAGIECELRDSAPPDDIRCLHVMNIRARVDEFDQVTDIASRHATAAGGCVPRIDATGSATRRVVLAIPGVGGRPELILLQIAVEADRPARISGGFGAGLHVALLGPDGVGKTSVSTALEQMLAPLFSRTSPLYLRPGLLPGRTPRGGPGGDDSPYSAPAYPPVRSMLKLAYLFADYTVGYPLVVSPLIRRGVLVLSDRYFFDAVADPRRLRYGGPARLAETAVALAPRPAVTIILLATAEEIQSRSPELSFLETESQVAAYRSLATGNDDCVSVDASPDSESVASAAAWVVLRTMAAGSLNRRPRSRRALSRR